MTNCIHAHDSVIVQYASIKPDPYLFIQAKLTLYSFDFDSSQLISFKYVALKLLNADVIESAKPTSNMNCKSSHFNSIVNASV